jgi:hypothetical protein
MAEVLWKATALHEGCIGQVIIFWLSKTNLLTKSPLESSIRRTFFTRARIHGLLEGLHDKFPNPKVGDVEVGQGVKDLK